MDQELVGKRLRYARRLQDLTQKAVAAKTGISYPTISRIETGQHPHLYATTLYTLAEFLDVSLDWVCGRTEQCRLTVEKSS